MILYATLAVCAVLAALLVYRYDMYDREPWYMVVATLLVAAAVMWFLGPVEDAVIDLFGVSPGNAVLAAVAATHEEVAKLGVVLGVALVARRHFNDPMDGIIYGSIAGLGMALSESVSTLQVDGAAGAAALPPEELVRLFSHLVLGGISGFAVGMMRTAMARWPAALAACMAASLTLHFAWDWISLSRAPDSAVRGFQTAAIVSLTLGATLLYGWLTLKASGWSRDRFEPHSARSLLQLPLAPWTEAVERR